MLATLPQTMNLVEGTIGFRPPRHPILPPPPLKKSPPNPSVPRPSPPLSDRLASAGFSRISMTKAAVGVRVKPEDEASKSSPNFLPGGGVAEGGWGGEAGARVGEQRRPGEEQRLRLYYMHLRPEKPRTMCLRHGQLRTGLPPAFSAGGRGGRIVGGE